VVFIIDKYSNKEIPWHKQLDKPQYLV
jgi:hypothetical protein